MKQSFLLIFLFLFSKTLVSQSNFDAIDSIVKKIKFQYDNLQKNFPSNLKNDEKKKYTFGKDFTLITVNTLEGGVLKKVSWYYDKAEHIYSEQKWTDASTGETVNTHQFYFRDKKPARWIDNGSVVDSNSEEFQSLPADLYNYAIFLLNE